MSVADLPRETRPAEPQARAADPRLSAFVTANAGSGKTKTLIDRVARLLLAKAEPETILCVTYTKAAAAEMQRRLYDLLGGWSVADDARLVRHYRDPAHGYTSRTAPQFVRTYASEYDHLARVFEWSTSGEGMDD